MEKPDNNLDTAGSKTSVPIVEEGIRVGSHELTAQRVVLSKKVEEHEELIDVPLVAENYRIERIPLNRTVDAAPTVRRVGDTTIIPVVEEVAVVNKQLVLREELHITRVPMEERRPQRVTLRRERVDVVTVPPQQSETSEFDDSGEVLMPKTIVGLFDNQQRAQAVLRELVNSGFQQSDIHCITLNGGTGNVESRLMSAGVPSEEVRHYSSEAQSGKAVLVLKTSDQVVQTAVTVLERNGAKDLDQRRSADMAGLSGNETTGISKADDGSTTTAIPVVEEELKVGKRQVTAGGVRIYTSVREQPVEQEVSLRKEHIDVERRPVNRPATEQDLREFKEGTIEVTATAEQPVIAKEAKVVEEVVVSKDVNQEQQTVRDTVCRTEVHVDDTPGQPSNRVEQARAALGSKSESGINPTPANDDYASTYAQTLATDPRYRGKDWAAIEPEAQRQWGTHHKGGWEEFKDRVRHAWEKMTGAEPRTTRY
ncbi:MAG TPA: YsnF/AvaK domain-containing protein [Candidatus Sulfotelmatobacter sp.]|nr:YsnF/AvaK domain-containing protein [Candidatus Sulfotelmatobacter sp.]